MRHISILLTAAFAFAQGPAFEVASVHHAEPGIKAMNIRRDPAGGISALNVNVRTLIVMAYNIQDHQLSGASGWIESERYDVIAKAPAGIKRTDTWAMLQTLLAERFHLAVHHETKEGT